MTSIPEHERHLLGNSRTTYNNDLYRRKRDIYTLHSTGTINHSLPRPARHAVPTTHRKERLRERVESWSFWLCYPRMGHRLWRLMYLYKLLSYSELSFLVSWNNVLYPFFGWLQCVGPLLCLCSPFMIFEGCLDWNPESLSWQAGALHC